MSLLCIFTAETARENCLYVQSHLSKYLRRALAAAFMHQPADPINFIANHLLKQRHTELIGCIAEIEHQRLQSERGRRQMMKTLAARYQKADPCDPCSFVPQL